MKTIDDMVKICGIAPATAYRKLNVLKAEFSHDLSLIIIEKDGKSYFTEHGEALYIERFSKRINDNQRESELEANIVAVLETTVNTLHEQLQVKDKLIESQQSTIKNLNESLNMAQQLHAGTIQKLLGSPEETISDPPEEIVSDEPEPVRTKPKDKEKITFPSIEDEMKEIYRKDAIRQRKKAIKKWKKRLKEWWWIILLIIAFIPFSLWWIRSFY